MTVVREWQMSKGSTKRGKKKKKKKRLLRPVHTKADSETPFILTPSPCVCGDGSINGKHGKNAAPQQDKQFEPPPSPGCATTATITHCHHHHTVPREHSRCFVNTVWFGLRVLICRLPHLDEQRSNFRGFFFFLAFRFVSSWLLLLCSPPSPPPSSTVTTS